MGTVDVPRLFHVLMTNQFVCAAQLKLKVMLRGYCYTKRLSSATSLQCWKVELHSCLDHMSLWFHWWQFCHSFAFFTSFIH